MSLSVHNEQGFDLQEALVVGLAGIIIVEEALLFLDIGREPLSLLVKLLELLILTQLRVWKAISDIVVHSLQYKTINECIPHIVVSKACLQRVTMSFLSYSVEHDEVVVQAHLLVYLLAHKGFDEPTT